MSHTEVTDNPLERLGSMDAHGHKLNLHPTDVRGPFKRRRMAFQAVLLVLFLVLPWIQINGHPAILLDIGQRRFSIFGLAFWAHDAPMLIFVFGSVLFAVSLMTAVWGRIWCGWACPETVFVEFVFRRIETWIEGNPVQRRRLDQSPWTGRKVWLRGLKWTAFAAVSLIITHSFLAYFVGIDKLAVMMRHSPSENPGTFGVMAFLSVVLLFSFGWFREQFCIIMCPYGRFQSVLQDEHSKMVVYDVVRGEPRRGFEGYDRKPALEKILPQAAVLDLDPNNTGDCIDCKRCVTACPTGIDIRRGLQLECIGCMGCLDACNEVMRNIKKPEGLITFASQNELQGKPVKHLRTRVVLMGTVLTAVLSGLTYVLITRPPIKTTVFHSHFEPYQVLDAKNPDQLISNEFFIMATNYTFEDGTVKLVVEATEAGHDEIKVVSPKNPLDVPAGQEIKQDFFVTFHKHLLKNGYAKLRFHLMTQAEDGSWKRELTQEVPLAGPF